MKVARKTKSHTVAYLRERGASLVETAIVVPVALLTACGIVSIGFGLDAAYNAHRIAFEAVSLMSFTNLSTGTNTTVGHAKVHARTTELANLQPKGFVAAPIVNSTFAIGPEAPESGGARSIDAIEIIKPRPRPRGYEGARVIASVDANFPRFFQRFNINIHAEYVGPYYVTRPTASGSVDFVNPLPLVDCGRVSGGADVSPCGYN